MKTGFSLWELTYREFSVSLKGFGFAVQVLCQLHTNFSSIDYLFVLTKVHERVEGVIKVFKEFIGALFGVH